MLNLHTNPRAAGLFILFLMYSSLSLWSYLYQNSQIICTVTYLQKNSGGKSTVVTIGGRNKIQYSEFGL